MRKTWCCAALAALCLAPLARIDGAAAPAGALPKPGKGAKSYEVPYRLTVPKHILVRVKINGKGPYNFILDTGALLLHVAVPAAKKAGRKANAKKWATIDRFEIEGGVVVSNVKAHVETPFQLEGMNGLGLAGVEVHGLIGYSVLAKYRMTIDFTRDKMKWVPLDYKPQPLVGLGAKGGQGGLEVIGGLMKALGSLMGKKKEPVVLLRGFLGVTLENGTEYPVVKGVLPKGPAGAAGVRVGDKISRVAGRGVYSPADVGQALAREVRPGQTFKLTVIRGAQTKEIDVKLGEGL